MYNVIFYILVMSFWFTLVLGSIVNIISRVLIIKQDTYSQKEKWMMLLTPFSYGIFKYAKESKYKEIHRILIIVFFITAIISSFLLFYFKLEIGVY